MIYRNVSLLPLKWYFVTGACLVLATCFHPGSKGEFFFTLQMFVSFSMFTEAAALVPQLHHVYCHKDTEGLNYYYLVCLGIARLCRLFFWWSMSTKRDHFWYMLLADIIHSALLLGFFLAFRRAKKSRDNAYLTGTF